MRAAVTFATLAVVASCAKPEKQLESGRQYTSIVYADSEFETFGRTDRSISGMVVSRYGDSVLFRIHTKPDASVSSVDFTARQATRRGGRTITKGFDLSKGSMPLYGNSVAFLEQVLRRARALGGDSIHIPITLVGAGSSTEELIFIRNGSDSALLVPPDYNLTLALHLAVDSVGHITGGMIPISGMQIQAR